MQVKIINKSNNPLPRYESEQAAGMDIRCHIAQPITLQPLERKLLPTGLYIELPVGYEAQIRPRSGLALKRGLTVLNTPGTIDAGYRNGYGVILMNLGTEPFEVRQGDKIAQAVLVKVEQIEWESVEFLDETDRNLGGFGSTDLIKN